MKQPLRAYDKLMEELRPFLPKSRKTKPPRVEWEIPDPSIDLTPQERS